MAMAHRKKVGLPNPAFIFDIQRGWRITVPKLFSEMMAKNDMKEKIMPIHTTVNQ